MAITITCGPNSLHYGPKSYLEHSFYACIIDCRMKSSFTQLPYYSISTSTYNVMFTDCQCICFRCLEQQELHVTNMFTVMIIDGKANTINSQMKIIQSNVIPPDGVNITDFIY